MLEAHRGTGVTFRYLRCPGHHLNRPAHTGCSVAGSIPPVLRPPLKGRAPKHTSVKTALLTEHVPGTHVEITTETSTGRRGWGRIQPSTGGRSADPRPLQGSRRYILRGIPKTPVAREKTKWAKVWGLGLGLGGRAGESGNRSAELCRLAGQGVARAC